MYLSLSDGHRGRAAELAGVGRATFYRAMRWHRVSYPKASAKVGPRQVELARTLRHDMGMPRAEVARVLDINPHTLRHLDSFETWRHR
jgi:hypothetical protein